jgi:hypothetical protein
MKPAVPIYQYKRPSRRLRWWNALRDLPYLLADGIGDDADPAFLRRLMLAVFLLFGLAVFFWLLAWITR